MSSSSDNYYIDVLNNLIVNIYRYGNPVIFSIGNIGNLLSAIIFFQKGWRKNVCVLYFKCFLFLSTAYINSNILGTTFTIGFNINIQNSSKILCKLFFYVPYVLSKLLPTVLILSSIDRLLISSQNVETRLYSSKRLAYFSICLSSIIFILLSIHVLIKVDIQVINPSFSICYYDPSKLYADLLSYSSTAFNCLVSLLMIILSIISFKNVRRIRTIPRQQQRNQIRSMTKRDFQLLRCLFVLDIAYMIASIFPSAYSIYAIANGGKMPTLLGRTIDDFFKNLSTFCYFTFFCTSLFIFFGVSKAFRNALKRILYKPFCQQLVASHEQDSGQENPVRNNIQINVVDVIDVVPPVVIVDE